MKFDFVQEEVEDFSYDTYLSVAKMTAEHLGIPDSDIVVLGSGSFGWAFWIRSINLVVKVTTDETEALAASIIMAAEHPNLYKVRKVMKTSVPSFKYLYADNPGGDWLYIIIYDYVEEIQDEDLLNILKNLTASTDYFKIAPPDIKAVTKNLLGIILDLKENYYSKGYNRIDIWKLKEGAYIDIRNDEQWHSIYWFINEFGTDFLDIAGKSDKPKQELVKYIGANKERIKKIYSIWTTIHNAVNFLYDHGIDAGDTRWKNMGLTKSGELVIIDVGASDIFDGKLAIEPENMEEL